MQRPSPRPAEPLDPGLIDVDVEELAALDQEVATAVLVHQGADVHRLRGDVLRAASGPDAEPGVTGTVEPLLPIARRLGDGAVYDHIVESDTTLMVLRRIGPDAGGIEVEAVVIEKRPYETWYRKQAARIPLVLVDQALAEAVCEEYGTAWWLEAACSRVCTGRP